MGALKVTKVLKEHIYIKGINKKISTYIKMCEIYQLVKCNNERKEGIMILLSENWEMCFLHICGPFPRSGAKHQYKFGLIMFDLIHKTIPTKQSKH